MRSHAPIVALIVLVICGALVACGGVPTPPAGSAGSAGAAPATGVPGGTVVAYYGTEIPAGWVLCDGRQTTTGRLTPDLRSRFVMGLDPATSALGEQGGSASHRHRGKSGPPNEEDEDLESGEDEHAANDGHTHDFATDDVNHLPPYVKLVYIMKE